MAARPVSRALCALEGSGDRLLLEALPQRGSGNDLFSLATVGPGGEHTGTVCPQGHTASQLLDHWLRITPQFVSRKDSRLCAADRILAKARGGERDAGCDADGGGPGVCQHAYGTGGDPAARSRGALAFVLYQSMTDDPACGVLLTLDKTAAAAEKGSTAHYTLAGLPARSGFSGATGDVYIAGDRLVIELSLRGSAVQVDAKFDGNGGLGAFKQAIDSAAEQYGVDRTPTLAKSARSLLGELAASAHSATDTIHTTSDGLYTLMFWLTDKDRDVNGTSVFLGDSPGTGADKHPVSSDLAGDKDLVSTVASGISAKAKSFGLILDVSTRVNGTEKTFNTYNVSKLPEVYLDCLRGVAYYQQSKFVHARHGGTKVMPTLWNTTSIHRRSMSWSFRMYTAHGGKYYIDFEVSVAHDKRTNRLSMVIVSKSNYPGTEPRLLEVWTIITEERLSVFAAERNAFQNERDRFMLLQAFLATSYKRPSRLMFWNTNRTPSAEYHAASFRNVWETFYAFYGNVGVDVRARYYSPYYNRFGD